MAPEQEAQAYWSKVWARVFAKAMLKARGGDESLKKMLERDPLGAYQDARKEKDLADLPTHPVMNMVSYGQQDKFQKMSNADLKKVKAGKEGDEPVPIDHHQLKKKP